MSSLEGSRAPVAASAGFGRPDNSLERDAQGQCGHLGTTQGEKANAVGRIAGEQAPASRVRTPHSRSDRADPPFPEVRHRRPPVRELLPKMAMDAEAADVVDDGQCDGTDRAATSVACMDVPVLAAASELVVIAADSPKDVAANETGSLDAGRALIAAALERLTACPITFGRILLVKDDGDVLLALGGSNTRGQGSGRQLHVAVEVE